MRDIAMPFWRNLIEIKRVANDTDVKSAGKVSVGERIARRYDFVLPHTNVAHQAAQGKAQTLSGLLDDISKSIYTIGAPGRI